MPITTASARLMFISLMDDSRHPYHGRVLEDK
jgi:hypothetical protein